EAIDIDARMVTSAKRNAATAAVDVAFREADMTSCDAIEEGSFDRVYSTMTFHHLSPEAKAQALAVANHAVARDGPVVIADFSRPRDPLQWALFAWIQQPLDGLANTRPHRDGRFEEALRTAFAEV